jgi:hypothetical protein
VAAAAAAARDPLDYAKALLYDSTSRSLKHALQSLTGSAEFQGIIRWGRQGPWTAAGGWGHGSGRGSVGSGTEALLVLLILISIAYPY